jgi:uncharacterized protein (TIGR03435 family)
MTALVEGVSGLVASFGASILVKATLTLLVALGAVRLARRTRASVRHLLLVAGFGTLLVMPTVTVLVPSVRVEVPPIPLVFEEYLDEAVSLDDQAPISPTPLPSRVAVAAHESSVTTAELVTAIQIAGVLLCGMPLFIGMVQVRRLRRTGLPWRAGQRLVDALAREAGVRRPIDVLLHESVAAPATCGLRRHAILFPIDADRWTNEDILRAAAHEVEHVRRADCLVNGIARTVCAAYWFHPLVWFAWRRLGLEAERACDDAVLRRAEADAYADQLVTLAGRLSASARHPLLAMANRSDLAQRVAAVLDQRQVRGRAGSATAVAIAIAAGALIVTLSPLQAVSAPSSLANATATGFTGLRLEPARAPVEVLVIERAEPLTVDTRDLSARGLAKAEPHAHAAQDRAGSAPPTFDVASIRRNSAGGVPRMRIEGGRLVASNTSLLELIRDAYRMQSFQVIGGPQWLRTAPGPNRAAPASQRPGEVTFDIIANIPQNTPPSQVPLMVRSLLVDRFKLVGHTETRDMPVYVLTFARDDKRLGPQLTRSTQQCQTENDGGPLRAPVTRVAEDGKPVCGMMMGPARIRGGGLTMTFLANALTGFTQRMVVDRTGLGGPFDFDLTYAPATRGPSTPLAAAGGRAPSDDRPSIFTAVQEQLGLKLEAATAPVEVLVVDSVSMPSEN